MEGKENKGRLLKRWGKGKEEKRKWMQNAPTHGFQYLDKYKS